MTRFELFRRTLWLTLRRSPRDKQIFKAIFWLVYVAAYLAYLIKSFSYLGLWGAVFEGVVLSLAIGVALLIARNNAQSSRSLISLSSYSDPAGQDFAEHRPQIVSLLLRNAILVDRAGAELLTAESRMPERHSGLSRRRILDLARSSNLLPLFSEEDRDLLISSEGSWSSHTTQACADRMEDVRVLRWVLHLDAVLVPFEFLEPNFMPALQITTTPSLLEGKSCMAPWDLRPARDAAQEVMHCCIAEGTQRGFYSVADQKVKTAYIEAAQDIRHFYVGMGTFAEASEERLRFLASTSLRRAQLLDQLIRYLGGDPKMILDFNPAES